MKTIAFDMSAMCLRAGSRTPRGIDRVDMGYAKHFFGDPQTPNVGLLPSPRRMGLLSGAEARAFSDGVESDWREGASPTDALSDWLWGRLAGQNSAGQNVPRPAARWAGRSGPLLRRLRVAKPVRRAAFRPACSAVPQGAVYVNVGQILLGCSWFFGWLDARPDVKSVFLVHDIIPLLYPEYCGPAGARHHARAMRTVAKRATALIATTQAAAAEIRDELKRQDCAALPIHVAALLVGRAFAAKRPIACYRPAAPFFITVGAIDQRKNPFCCFMFGGPWRDGRLARRLNS